MIKNYFKTALRIMARQKGYAAINIIGLSIGIAATLIIIIYIVDELGYDKMHVDGERIYRVGFTGRLQGSEFTGALSPAPVAEAMQREIPDVAEVVRFGLWRTMPITMDDKAFTEKHVLVADSNFFKFFSFPVVEGDVNTFLKGTNKAVITESAAKRYFGNTNPVGKIMLRGAEKTATEVTGVVKDAPYNSHIPFDMVLSGESWDYMKDDMWVSNNLYTYFKLQPNGDIEKVKSQLDEMSQKNMGAQLEKLIGMSFEEFKKQGSHVGLFIQPMQDIHLKSNIREEMKPNGNIQYIYVFAAVAAFIILIACINFMNLSTARSTNRAKEVGVRKTVGAYRERLIFQFLSESILYSFLSTLIAIAIVGVSLDSFNMLSGKELSLSVFLNPFIIGGILAFSLFIGIIAGSYPAFYLTSFKPTDVLKGKLSAGLKNSALRNVLVVLQFTISIVLIFGSIMVYRQLAYVQSKNLGFDKENVVNLLHTFSLGKNSQAFKNELLANPMFNGASFSNNLPPNISWNSAFGKGGSDQDFLLSIYQMDHDHLATMGYEMVEGRFFSREFKSDSAAVILNETAYKQMGFKNLDEAEILSYNTDKPTPLKVIGVMKDFNFRGLRDNVAPMGMFLGEEPNFEMAVRLAPGNTQKQIATLESIYKKYAPGAPFEYSFLDQNFELQFRAEQRMSTIILVFAILAIGIACLGLFGLAAYVAEQRAKEMSIRKVMGASVSQVLLLLSKDFMILVVGAFVLATPLGLYLINTWLENFPYRISVDVSAILVSGLAAVLVAMFTISFQSIKAARENPVRAMRNE
jgi:putative ABC transport system permease protein